jgi:hypothetical protein
MSIPYQLQPWWALPGQAMLQPQNHGVDNPAGAHQKGPGKTGAF